jgi:predicted ArsR family transcriptional regulator
MNRLVRVLPLLSIADADMVANELQIDPNVARRHLNRLVEAGIAKEVGGGPRYRMWRVDEVHRLLDDHALGRTPVKAD